MDWKKQFIDQSAHIFLGFVIASPILLLRFDGITTYLVAASVALLAGISRELAQMMKARQAWYEDRTVDSIFHIPGGLIIAILAHWLR